MKKPGKWGIFCLVLVCMSLALGGVSSAHELWVEIEEVHGGDKLKIEVMWGHIRDFLDQASHEDYELFVRTPGGQVKELELEGIGVQGRTFLEAGETGQYVFWALREPGTYTPTDGVTTLSVQMAKTVYQHGDGPETAGKPVEMLLEIVPEKDVAAFPGGSFEGTVLLEGEPTAAAISAYGPSDKVLESESSADGSFELNMDSPGVWLVKASLSTREDGTHNGEEYSQVSRTTTLVLNVGGESQSAPAVPDQASGGTLPLTSMLAPFFIGLLLGGAGMLFYTGNKQKG